MNQSVTLDCIIFGLQQYGGISNYWARLLDSHTASTLTSQDLILPRDILFRGFKEEWLTAYPVQRELISPRFSRFLPAKHNNNCEILHTSYYRMPARNTKKYVVTAYDFMYERYRKGPASWIHAIQKRRSLERADIISCISSFTRDEVLEFCPRVDGSRLHVVPLGVDTNIFYHDKQTGDEALSQIVLYVGLRGGYKRFDLAVKAVGAACVRLTLGIIGPVLNKDERDFLNTTLGNRWQYFGAVSTLRLRQLYSSAYALIFPSDCEGFGLPVLEAMACHCPVVAANRASLPEIGGNAALYAPEQRVDDFAEALNLLKQHSLRQCLIRRGETRVSMYTWTNTFNKTQALYRALA